MAFTRYKPLKFALDGIPASNLTDFPKRFKIVGDADIAAECASGGGIKVTTPDGTTDLPIEVLWSETDLSTGDIEFWVKVDLLTAANVGDVIARLYYAAGETTDEDHAGVWSNGYALVMHLEEDPSGTAPQMYDSVSESYIGTSAGSMTSGDLVSGQVGNGLDFDGVNDAINCGTGFGSIPLSAFAVEISVKVSANNNSKAAISWDGTDDLLLYPFDIVGGNGARVFWRDTGGDIINENSVDRADGNFHRFTFVSYSTTNHRLFVDGVQAATSTANSANAGPFEGPLLIGGWAGSGSQYIPATIDEVRISSVARSADWIAYAYQDDFFNADTFTLGDEEGGGGPSFVDNTRNYLHCILGGAL